MKNLFLFFECLWQGCTPKWNTHEVILRDTEVKQRLTSTRDSIILYWSQQTRETSAMPRALWPWTDHFTSLSHSFLDLWNKNMGSECLSLHHTNFVSLPRNDLKARSTINSLPVAGDTTFLKHCNSKGSMAKTWIKWWKAAAVLQRRQFAEGKTIQTPRKHGGLSTTSYRPDKSCMSQSLRHCVCNWGLNEPNHQRPSSWWNLEINQTLPSCSLQNYPKALKTQRCKTARELLEKDNIRLQGQGFSD